MCTPPLPAAVPRLSRFSAFIQSEAQVQADTDSSDLLQIYIPNRAERTLPALWQT